MLDVLLRGLLTESALAEALACLDDDLGSGSLEASGRDSRGDE